MINILVATHGELANGLKSSVKMLAGEYENYSNVTFKEGMSFDTLKEMFADVMSEVSDEEQWVIFVDILGGSPFKAASEISFNNDNVVVYYGVNLPMLIQALMSRDDKTLEAFIGEFSESLEHSVGKSKI